MQLAHRWSDRNLTRIELVMALLVLDSFRGVFSRHVLILFARAKKTFVESTVININTALRYYTVTLLMDNNTKALTNLGRINQMIEMRSETGMNEIDSKELYSYNND